MKRGPKTTKIEPEWVRNPTMEVVRAVRRCWLVNNGRVKVYTIGYEVFINDTRVDRGYFNRLLEQIAAMTVTESVEYIRYEVLMKRVKKY